MRTRPLALLVVACLALSLACAKPRGGSASEKRAYVRTMRNEALADFYKANPGLRSRVQNAAGYAVFSDVSVKVFVVATGHGYGLAVDNQSGRETFMRVASAGGGVGMGIKDMRALFVFHDRNALRTFIEEGLEFGGQAEVAATAGDVGVAAGTQVAATEAGASGGLGGRSGETLSEAAGAGVSVDRLTQTGAAASATLSGTKYWKDKELN
jgi:lipid-binding SYLF domain-containing protein